MAEGKKFPLSIELKTIDRATVGIRKIDKSLGGLKKKLEGVNRASKRTGRALNKGLKEPEVRLLRVTKRVNSLGKTLEGVSKKLTKNLTLPIVGLGVAVLKVSGDFESGMAKIATLGGTNAQIEKVGKSVLDLGKKTPATLSDLQAGFYGLRSAGSSVDEAMRRLKPSAELGIAALGNTEQAVDITTSAINAFGLKGQATTKVMDTLFKVVKNGKTTLPQMTSGFGKAAAAARGSKVSVEDFAASVTAMTLGGLKAPEAYTQITAVLGALGKKTKGTSKLFKQLGVKDFDELMRRSGGLGGALKVVNDHLDGNASKIKKLTASTEAASAVMIIGGAQNTAYASTLKDMVHGEDEVSKAAAIRGRTQKARIQKLKNSLASVSISLGRLLVPVLKKVTDMLMHATKWFEGLSDGTKKWIVTIAGVAAVIGPALFILGKLSTALSFVTVAIKGIGLALALNPIVALVSLIALSALAIYKNWEPIKEFFILLWDGITAAFNAALRQITAVASKIISVAKRVKSLAFGSTSGAANLALQAEVARQGGATGSLVRPTQGAPGAGGTASVKVEFANAPRGTRVTESAGSTVPLDTAVGYQMGL